MRHGDGECDRCFSALSEAGLGDTKDLVVLQRPAESTYDHFFKEFAHTAGKAYWPVSARVGLAWPEELHWNAARTEELPVNQILLNNCNMTSNDFVDKCLNIS